MINKYLSKKVLSAYRDLFSTCAIIFDQILVYAVNDPFNLIISESSRSLS